MNSRPLHQVGTATRARYQTHEVRVYALHRTPCDGTHFALVCTGCWPEVLRYLNATARFVSRDLWIEPSDGAALRPLFA